MKPFKRYAPTLLTVLLVALGAAMPWLSALAQDARIDKLQEELDLNTVSLTLLQSSGVEQALRIASLDHIDIPWNGGTNLTQQDALQAGITLLYELGAFGLLSYDDLDILEKVGGRAEPSLMVAEDGSSVLVWNCSWNVNQWANDYFVAVDDASGKAVRFYASGADGFDNQVSLNEKVLMSSHYYVPMNIWIEFLHYYYETEATGIWELEDTADSGARFAVELEFYSEEESCTMELDFYYADFIFSCRPIMMLN